MNIYKVIKDKTRTSKISTQKRMKNILFISFLIFIILIGRIGYIQISTFSDEEVSDKFSEKLNELKGLFNRGDDELPRQIIHRDPNPSNILMTDKQWGILDFDLAERNIRIYDPCYAATAILSESFEASNDQKLQKWCKIYKNILYGYDSVAKLTKTEWKAAPYVVLANQLVCTIWFSKKEQYQELYEINKKMTWWIIEHFDQLRFEED